MQGRAERRLSRRCAACGRCIYAILAVDLFGRFAEDGMYERADGATEALYSDRGLHFGDEYYGCFSRSLYTLFQVLTGDGWSEVTCRAHARRRWTRAHATRGQALSSAPLTPAAAGLPRSVSAT
jgi:hypothetical protein